MFLHISLINIFWLKDQELYFQPEILPVDISYLF